MWRKIRLFLATLLAPRGYAVYWMEGLMDAEHRVCELGTFVTDESGHFTNGYKGVRRVIRDLQFVELALSNSRVAIEKGDR